VGRPSAARTATDSPGFGSPAAVWWWSMVATRRLRVAGASGHPVRMSMTVCGSVGSGVMSAAAHQPVNRAKSVVEVRTVRADNTRAGSAVTLTVLVSLNIGY